MGGEQAHRPPVPKIVVLSDLHMVPAGDTIIGIDPYLRLRNAIGHINRHHGDAERVIILGDLVHGGDAASYRRLGRLLADLSVPCSLMIGNHDHRPTFCTAFPGAPTDADGFVQMEHRLQGYRLLLLDSVLDRPHASQSHASGHLCDRRLAWLDGRLREARDDRILLMLHHPPMATGFPGMDAIGLSNAGALLALLQQHGNVAHIFAGHVHRTISGSWHGIPFSIFKSPVHQQPMDLRSTSSSLSVDEPAAMGIALLSPAGVIVHTDDYELTAAASL